MFPSRKYHYVLKKGLQGHDVWALQINLHAAGFAVSMDGVFGMQTKTAVQRFQDDRKLSDDGVAGILTQRSLALKLIEPVQDHEKTPHGLIRGIVEGESGWVVGATNWSVAGGVDCGWAQRRVYEQDYDETHFERAFNGKVQFGILAQNLRGKKKEYFGRKGATTHKRAWELAVLYHNWPAAAGRLSQGLSIYFDASKDHRYAQWVASIGVKGVTSPAQWADYYVDSKTQYVTTWPA